MTTLAALVEQTPAADRGAPVQLVDGPGVWRHVLELADPAAGASVVWYDITGYFRGYEYTRGAQGYQGRYRASVGTVDLYAPGDDSLAPWNSDTSPTFGTHVDLGPGLLIRSGLIRVLGGVVVEWNPRFTLKVEVWGDASYAQGKVRQHRIVARDTLTSLVAVPLPANIEENWSDRMYHILTDSGWAYGSLVYGAQFTDPGGVEIMLLPERPAASSAVNELDVALDPAGLVWYTNRLGQLVVRPTVYDTFHADAFAAGATGDQWEDDVEPCSFGWWACSEENPTVAAYAMDGVNPFGLDRTELAVINHVKISDPVTAGFDDDDPISIQRYDRHTFQASWVAANDQVASDLLDFRANATVEARPLLTNVDLPGFHTGPDTVDYLDYVTLVHQNRDGGLQAFANGFLRDYREQVFPRGCDIDWSMTITIDVVNYSSTVGLLPVEDLTLEDVTDTSAEFSWTNPAQTVTPTHTQIRMIGSALWATVDYPITGIIWGALEPSTGYEFQVRLLRMVDGLITHVSPTRSIAFVTEATTVPDVDVDGDITFPPPDTGCTLEWELQSSPDDVTWTTEESGTVLVPPWEVPTPDVSLGGDLLWRMRSRELCPAPGPWLISNLFVGLCSDPPALGGAPFDDDFLRFYLPGICPTDRIVEAISEDEATTGPQYDDFTTDGDGNVVLVSAGEGLVVYGANPTMTFTPGLDGLTGDATLAVKVLVTTQPDGTVVLFGAAGLWIEAVPDGANWSVRAKAHEAGAGITTISGTTLLDFGAWYDLAVTHDTATGDLVLWVDAIEEADALGMVAVRHNPGIYEVSLPAGSLVTNAAVWARVLDQTELPGFAGIPPSVDIDLEAGQSDPTTDAAIQFTATFSEAVTGFATGDVTLGGTAGATTVTVLGSGAVYTLTVTGMTATGTVVVSIPAAVCTSVATGLANTASTHTDNTVSYTAGPPITGMWAHYDASDAASITHSSGAVSQWNDKSGNGRHVTQVTGGAKPSTGTRTINGLNVLDFDGGDWLQRASVSFATGNWTIFMVTGSDGTPSADYQGLLTFHLGSGNDYDSGSALTITVGDASNQLAAFMIGNVMASGSGATPIGTWTIRKDYLGTNAFQILTPGATLTTATNNTSGTASNLVLGARYTGGSVNGQFNGPIAEVVIYSSTLNDTDRNAVRAYLIAKWGA